MKIWVFLLALPVLFISQDGDAQLVEEVRTIDPETPALPEDLFRLPQGTWVFARRLWAGDDPCTAEECEGGYTAGDLVISAERSKRYLRIVAGFRNCGNVAWNEYKVGDKASSGDTRTIGKRIKKTVETAAQYCKQAVPAIATLDARWLYPDRSQPKQ